MLMWPYIDVIMSTGITCQQKKKAIELMHEWLVNFGLNSLLHTQ